MPFSHDTVVPEEPPELPIVDEPPLDDVEDELLLEAPPLDEPPLDEPPLLFELLLELPPLDEPPLLFELLLEPPPLESPPPEFPPLEALDPLPLCPALDEPPPPDDSFWEQPAKSRTRARPTEFDTVDRMGTSEWRGL